MFDIRTDIQYPFITNETRLANILSMASGYPGRDCVMTIQYDTDDNSFYDERGVHIDNILEIITPNDLYLFRSDPKKYYLFPHRELDNVLCEIQMALWN